MGNTVGKIGNRKNEIQCNNEEDFALLRLNDDCLSEIIKYLESEDTLNLSRTSDRLRQLAQSRYKEIVFNFHSDMYCDFDRILCDVGAHLKSWSLTIDQTTYGKSMLKKVGKYCPNLKRLEVKRVYRTIDITELMCKATTDYFYHVETLIFDSCDVSDASNFFSCFRKLRYLSFRFCYIRLEDVKTLFENNPDIESFDCYGVKIRGALIVDGWNHFREERIPTNVLKDMLGPDLCKCCTPEFISMMNFDTLLRLPTKNLTKLKLSTRTINLRAFLIELAKNGTLEELELTDAQMNRASFNILKSFKKLHWLVLRPLNPSHMEFTLSRNSVWPPNLKLLHLGLNITLGGFKSMIQQLKHLEDFILDECAITGTTIEKFYNIPAMSQFIKKSNRSTQKLNIVMSKSVSYVMDSDGLRLSRPNWKDESLK